MTTLGQVKKTTNTIFTCSLEIIQYALKGQKRIAQGIALGNYERQPVALKGKSVKEAGYKQLFCPFRASC